MPLERHTMAQTWTTASWSADQGPASASGAPASGGTAPPVPPAPAPPPAADGEPALDPALPCPNPSPSPAPGPSGVSSSTEPPFDGSGPGSTSLLSPRSLGKSSGMGFKHATNQSP